jgi:hypothetical protein
MYADTLLLAERAYLLLLLVWGAASIVAGTAVVGLLAPRWGRSPLLRQFGIQTLGWGLVEASVALFRLRGLELRDLGRATRLDRVLWLSAGLDLGYVAVGVTLALAGWLMGRRLAALGAGIGVVVQGIALLVLHLHLLSVTARIP